MFTCGSSKITLVSYHFENFFENAEPNSEIVLRVPILNGTCSLNSEQHKTSESCTIDGAMVILMMVKSP